MSTGYTIAATLFAIAAGLISMAILSEREREDANRDYLSLTKAIYFAGIFLFTLLAWHLPRGMNLMFILGIMTLAIWSTMTISAKPPEAVTARFALFRLTLVLVCFAGIYASLLRTKDPSLFKPLFYIFIIVAAGAVHLFELSAIRRIKEGIDESAEERRARVYRIAARTIWAAVGVLVLALIVSALG